MSQRAKKLLRLSGIIIALLVLWAAALHLANFVGDNGTAQEFVGQFGYLGVLIIAIIAGINIVIPIHAATFVPVFVEAGLWLPLIIAMLVIGTTIADTVGYIFGKWSREFVEVHYPKTYERVLKLNKKHRGFLLPFVFVYAAFAPFPNEAILIPLALIGIRFKLIFIPLIFGNLVHHTTLALASLNIYRVFF